MEQIGVVDSAHALLKAVYQNPQVPLPVRMRAAIACLPFEAPKLAVTAVVSDKDFATLLENRLKRIEQVKLIEARPTEKVDARLAPPIPDRRYRRI